MSGDGNTLLRVGNSINIGKLVSGSWVWTQANTNGIPTDGYWSCWDINYDGTAVIAGLLYGYLWMGRLSSGAWSWTQYTDLYSTPGCAISADGTRATASTSTLWTGMYASGSWTWARATNNGETWPLPYVPIYTSIVAISADGSTMGGCSIGKDGGSYTGAGVWIGTYTGTSWFWYYVVNIYGSTWKDFALSGDGKAFIAAQDDGSVFVGRFSSGAWSVAYAHDQAPWMSSRQKWGSVAISTDGNTYLAGSADTSGYNGRGLLYLGKYNPSSGATTWTILYEMYSSTLVVQMSVNWQTVSLNGDGTRIIAGTRLDKLWAGIYYEGSWKWSRAGDTSRYNWYWSSLSQSGDRATGDGYVGTLYGFSS